MILNYFQKTIWGLLPLVGRTDIHHRVAVVKVEGAVIEEERVEWAKLVLQERARDPLQIIVVSTSSLTSRMYLRQWRFG